MDSESLSLGGSYQSLHCLIKKLDMDHVKLMKSLGYLRVFRLCNVPYNIAVTLKFDITLFEI